MIRALVIGGAGFIGSFTVNRLLANGYEVRILDSLAPPVHHGRQVPAYVSPEAEFLHGDVRDREGHLIPGAEIRWFQMPSEESCPNADQGAACGIPARLVGIWESDDDGQVVAVLPDP